MERICIILTISSVDSVAESLVIFIIEKPKLEIRGKGLKVKLYATVLELARNPLALETLGYSCSKGTVVNKKIYFKMYSL